MMVSFFNSPKQLKNRKILKEFILKLCKSEGKKIKSINIIYVNDSELLEINIKYLNHDYYTDIITFDLTPDINMPLTAELYISIDRIHENSMNHNTSFREELHRVIFHGLLHLCGYKDKTRIEKIKMTEAENKYLSIYNKILNNK